MDADRFERLVGQVLEETRALRQESNERFHALDQKVTALDQKVASLDQKVASLDQRLHALDQKVTAEFATVNKKIDMLGGAVVDLRARVEILEKAAE